MFGCAGKYTLQSTHCAMESRGMLRGPKEVEGGTGALWGQGGCLGDIKGPSGWFDESSDYS